MSTPAGPRRYHSPTRQKNADETRSRVVDAARTLLIENGYDGTTIDGIARAAGVSTQTVYAAFGSKRGIVAELLERARFGPAYGEVVSRAMGTDDPRERLRFTARIARQIYEAEQAEFAVLRGAGAVSPELAALEQGLEDQRHTKQAPIVALLSAAGLLAVSEREAADVLFMLTARDVYRMLVQGRGWSPTEYEAWLAEHLEKSLLVPREQGTREKRRRKK